MKKVYHLLALTVILSITSACTSNPTSLNRDALKQDPITTVHLAAAEKPTYVRSTTGSSTAAGIGGGFIGGMIGAGIDVAINNRRHNAMAPVVAALHDYNIEQKLSAKLKALKGESFANNLEVQVVENIKNADDAKAKVLRIKAISYLGTTHQHVETHAEIHLKPAKENESEYFRRFKESVAVDFGGDTKVNATQYLVRQPEKLKAAIDQTLDTIVKKITDDINTAPPTNK